MTRHRGVRPCLSAKLLSTLVFLSTVYTEVQSSPQIVSLAGKPIVPDQTTSVTSPKAATHWRLSVDLATEKPWSGSCSLLVFAASSGDQKHVASAAQELQLPAGGTARVELTLPPHSISGCSQHSFTLVLGTKPAAEHKAATPAEQHHEYAFTVEPAGCSAAAAASSTNSAAAHGLGGALASVEPGSAARSLLQFVSQPVPTTTGSFPQPTTSPSPTATQTPRSPAATAAPTPAATQASTPAPTPARTTLPSGGNSPGIIVQPSPSTSPAQSPPAAGSTPQPTQPSTSTSPFTPPLTLPALAPSPLAQGIATPAPVQLPGGCLSGSGADCIKAAFFLDTGCTSNVGGQRLALPRVELNSSASVCNISSILQQHDQAAAASFSLQNGQCPAASQVCTNGQCDCFCQLPNPSTPGSPLSCPCNCPQVTPADALSTRCGQQQCSGPNSTTAFRSVLLAPGATLYLLNSSSAQAPCASNNLLSGSSSVALRNTLAQPQCFSLGDLQGYPFQNTSFFSFVEVRPATLTITSQSTGPTRAPAPAPGPSRSSPASAPARSAPAPAPGPVRARAPPVPAPSELAPQRAALAPARSAPAPAPGLVRTRAAPVPAPSELAPQRAAPVPAPSAPTQAPASAPPAPSITRSLAPVASIPPLQPPAPQLALEPPAPAPVRVPTIPGLALPPAAAPVLPPAPRLAVIAPSPAPAPVLPPAPRLAVKAPSPAAVEAPSIPFVLPPAPRLALEAPSPAAAPVLPPAPQLAVKAPSPAPVGAPSLPPVPALPPSVPIKPPAPAPVDHLLLALQTAGPAPQPVLSPAAVPARGPTATPVPAPALAVEPPVPSLSAADIVQRSISARAPSPSANPPAPKVAAPAPAPAQLDRLVGTFSLGDLLEAAALTPAVATLAGSAPHGAAPTTSHALAPSAAAPAPGIRDLLVRPGELPGSPASGPAPADGPLPPRAPTKAPSLRDSAELVAAPAPDALASLRQRLIRAGAPGTAVRASSVSGPSPAPDSDTLVQTLRNAAAPTAARGAVPPAVPAPSPQPAALVQAPTPPVTGPSAPGPAIAASVPAVDILIQHLLAARSPASAPSEPPLQQPAAPRPAVSIPPDVVPSAGIPAPADMTASPAAGTPAASAPSPSAAPPSPDLAAIIQRLIQSRAPTAAPPLQLPISLPPIPAPGSSDAAASPQPAASAPILAALLQKLSRPPSPSQAPSAALSPELAPLLPAATAPDLSASPAPAPDPALLGLAGSAPGPGPAASALVTQAPGLAPGPAPSADSLARAALLAALAGRLNNTNGAPGPAPAPAAAPKPLAVPAPAPLDAIVPARAPAASNVTQVPVSGPALAPAMARNPTLAPAVAPASAPIASAPAPSLLLPFRPGTAPAPAPVQLTAAPAPGNATAKPFAPLPSFAVAPASAPFAAGRALAPAVSRTAPAAAPVQAPGPGLGLGVIAGGLPPSGAVNASSPSGLRVPGTNNATAPAGSFGAPSPSDGGLVSAAAPGERALAPAFGPQPSQTVPIIPFVPVFPSASERSVSGANQTLVAFTVAPTTTAFFINPTTGMLERVDPGSINATAANNIIVGSDTFGLRVFSQDPLNTLPKDALRVRGGSVDGTTPVGTAGREFEAQLRAAPATGTVPNRQVVVNANPGFQLGNGLTLNGEANQITVTVDDTPPQATITLKNAYQTDSVPDPAFLISFGKRVRAYDPTKLYTLTGTNRTDVAYNVDSGEIYVAAYVQDQAIGTTITVTVNDGVTTDVVGNRNRGATFSYQYKPTPQPSTAVAQTVNALGGGALALTTVMPFISSLGSAATPAATFAAQHLLSQGQIFYLASHMAVANLPQNFRDIGNTFSWTMLDIRAPWEAKDVGVGGQFPTTPMAVNTPVFGDPASTERFFALPQQGVAPAQPANGKAAPAPAAGGGGLARKLLQDHMSRFGRRLMQQNETLALPGLDSQRFVVTSTGLDKVSSSPDATVNNGGIGSLKALALGQGNSLYTSLYRALFWLGVGLVGITLLQAACISLLMYLRKKRPNILHFPRPQLFVLLVAAPAIAQGAAKLFSGSATDIIVGVILVVFLPVMFIILAIGFVYSAVYHRRSRKAVFVLEHDPILGQHSRHAHGHKGSVVLDVLFGRTLTSGTWQPAKRPESNFVPRWGALFEDNRGEPMVLTGATYAVDPVTGALNRGQLVPVPGKAIISIGRLRVHRHQLQAYANLFEALKVISLALLTNGISSSPNNNLAQVVAMLAIVTVYLLYLRFFKPIERRTELAIQIVSEVMSMFVFACGIVLIAKGHVSPRFRLNLGIAMLVAQAIAFLAYLLHILRLVWENVSGNVIPNLKFLPRSPAAKFAAVVRQVMQKDEHILARKYSDRWMIKVLKIGLFKRRPFRTELVDPRKALYRAVTLEAVTTKLRRGRSGEGSGLQGMSSGDFGSEVGSPKLWGLRSPKAGAIANGNGKLPKWPSVEMGAEGQHKEGAEATGMMRSNPILESLADEVINTPPAETSAASRRRSGFDGRPGSPVGVNPDLLKSSNPVFELDSDRRSASSASSSTRPPWRRPNAKVPPDEVPNPAAKTRLPSPVPSAIPSPSPGRLPSPEGNQPTSSPSPSSSYPSPTTSPRPQKIRTSGRSLRTPLANLHDAVQEIGRSPPLVHEGRPAAPSSGTAVPAQPVAHPEDVAMAPASRRRRLQDLP